MSEPENTEQVEQPSASPPQTATQDTAPSTTQGKSNDKSDAVKSAQGDALTPDQKHRNYLDDIERLHNEP